MSTLFASSSFPYDKPPRAAMGWSAFVMRKRRSPIAMNGHQTPSRGAGDTGCPWRQAQGLENTTAASRPRPPRPRRFTP